MARRKCPSFSIHCGGEPMDKQLVPTSPTMEMIAAAVHALDGVDLSKHNRKDRAIIKAAVRYQAMLKAAPKIPPVDRTGAEE